MPRGVPACRFRRQLGLVVDVARLRFQFLRHPDRGTRLREHRIAVQGSRAGVNESTDACVAAGFEQPARRINIDRPEFLGTARREIGHVQGRGVDDCIAAADERRETLRVPNVCDLGRERALAKIHARDLVAKHEPCGDRASDTSRRAGDQDLHGSRVVKLTRRPTRHVSS